MPLRLAHRRAGGNRALDRRRIAGHDAVGDDRPRPREPRPRASGHFRRDARLLFIGKHIERIGDYATDICELTVYMAEAAIIKHVH